MICRQIIELLEGIAPQNYAESWDNCGLSYGDTSIEVNKIMIALEPTCKVIDEAIEKKADMIITHHPMIFSPIKTLSYDKIIGKKITKLAKNDIVSYSMHTNMDVTVMASEAGIKLGLLNMKRLEESFSRDGEEESNFIGLGSIGDLPYENNITLGALSELVKDRFIIDKVRVVGELDKKVKRIAILPGSGKSYINKAINQKVDVLITGDIDYHSAVNALEEGLAIIDAGHFDTEHFFVDYLYDYLQKHLKDYEIILEKATENSPFTII